MYSPNSSFSPIVTFTCVFPQRFLPLFTPFWRTSLCFHHSQIGSLELIVSAIPLSLHVLSYGKKCKFCEGSFPLCKWRTSLNISVHSTVVGYSQSAIPPFISCKLNVCRFVPYYWVTIRTDEIFSPNSLRGAFLVHLKLCEHIFFYERLFWWVVSIALIASLPAGREQFPDRKTLRDIQKFYFFLTEIE